MMAPDITRTPTLEGVLSFGVLDFLREPHVLAKLAMVNRALKHEVESLELCWLRLCLKAFVYYGDPGLDLGDFYKYKPPGGGPELFEGATTWMRVYGLLMKCRDVTSDRIPWGPNMALCRDESNPKSLGDKALPWGGEVWTRNCPGESVVRRAHGQLRMLAKDLHVEQRDNQNDNYPVAVALYRRPHTRSYSEIITHHNLVRGDKYVSEDVTRQILDATNFWYDHRERDASLKYAVSAVVGEPTTVDELLASPMFGTQVCGDQCFRALDRGEPADYPLLGVIDALGECNPFLHLCIGGERAALSPGVAMALIYELCEKISKRIHRLFNPYDGSDVAYREVGHKVAVQMTKVIPRLFAERLGPDDERLLQLRTAFVEAFAAPEMLQRIGSEVIGDMEVWQCRLEKSIREAEASVGEALRHQIRAVEASGEPSTTNVVLPIALSDSNWMPRSLFPRFGNDHEGRVAYIYVADKWALLVCHKRDSC